MAFSKERTELHRTGKLEVCVVSCELVGDVFLVGAFGKKEMKREGWRTEALQDSQV